MSKGLEDYRMTMSALLLAPGEPILYVSLHVADRPRAIDQVINYFGEAPKPRRAPKGWLYLLRDPKSTRWPSGSRPASV